ncbi:hypothetical protein EMCRGX_G005035 [Ephydatia muelleri]
MMTFVLQNGCSPLYAASFGGHLDVVKTLLEAGANINQVNKSVREAGDPSCLGQAGRSSDHHHVPWHHHQHHTPTKRLYLHLQDPSSKPEPEKMCQTLHPESEDSSESSSEGSTTESTLYIFNQFASVLHWIMPQQPPP